MKTDTLQIKSETSKDIQSSGCPFRIEYYVLYQYIFYRTFEYRSIYINIGCHFSTVVDPYFYNLNPCFL